MSNMKPYGSKRSFDTEPRIKSGRALVKREGEALAEEQQVGEVHEREIPKLVPAHEPTIARLEAEIKEARNEAATVRRAYLHEKKRAEDAIEQLEEHDPDAADVLRDQAYRGAADLTTTGMRSTT